MTFVWDQPGVLVRPFIDPPAPRAFAVCIRAANSGSACSWPGVWNSTASAIPRKLVRNASGVAIGYRYTLRPAVALPDTWLDRPIAWTVIACAHENGTACAASTPRTLHVSSIDLMPENVSIGGSSSTQLIVDGAAINLGTGYLTASVRSDLLSLPAFLDGMGVCATDVNGPDYVNAVGLAAVLASGILVPFSALPKHSDGTYDTSSVRAIIRSADPVLVGDFTMVSASNLVPGGRPAATQTLSTSIGAASRPLGVASILKIDGSGAIVEYNEDNNVLVECKTLN